MTQDNGLFLITFYYYDEYKDDDLKVNALVCAPSAGVAVDKVISDYKYVSNIHVDVWIAPDELGSIDYILLPNNANVINALKDVNDY